MLWADSPHSLVEMLKGLYILEMKQLEHEFAFLGCLGGNPLNSRAHPRFGPHLHPGFFIRAQNFMYGSLTCRILPEQVIRLCCVEKPKNPGMGVWLCPERFYSCKIDVAFFPTWQ